MNLDKKDWERYDIDWPEFNSTNMNYLNIGIPPVVNQKYRHKYMQFWNKALPDELNRTLSMKPPARYANGYSSPAQPAIGQQHQRESPFATSAAGGPAHINYYPDRTTEDPLRALKFLLNRHNPNEHSDMYNTQSTAVTATIIDNGTPYASVDGFNDEHNKQANMRMPDGNQIIVKADATLSILITVIVCFVLLNALAISAYLVRRYYTSRTLQCKLDVTDGGTTEADADAKRFKGGRNGGAGGDCGDESFMLNSAAMRMKQKQHSNDYETVVTGIGIGGGARCGNHSPINGYLLDGELSTSTMDAHTKVSDWMCQEILNGDSQLQQQPMQPKKHNSVQGFSLKGRGFFRRCIKTNDATKTTTTTTTPDAILETDDDRHIEYQKQRSYDTIICEDVDVDASLIDGSMGLRSHRRSSIPSLRGSVADGAALKIDHRYSRSDPVQMYYRRAPAPDDDITCFIEDPSMSSTRDASMEREPLSAAEALNTIRMRNYPKVLPRVPDDSTEYVSSALIKRRSLPPQYFGMLPVLGQRMPPAPPPRTTSTLGRSASKRDSNLITTSPLQMAVEPPLPSDQPEITCNVLHVGPLLPKSTESIYSTVTRTPRSPLRTVTPQFTFENCVTIETTAEPQATQQPVAVHRSAGAMRPPIAHRSSTESLAKCGPPKVAMRPSLLRQTSGDSHHRMSVQSIPEESVAIGLQPTPSQLTTGKVISSRIPQAKQRASVDRSGSEASSASKTSSSSSELSSSSGAETVKQVF